MDQNLILRKLKELKQYVKELERFKGQELSNAPEQLSTLWAIEHGLQLAIQIVIDVGNHILASIGETRIEDYVDVIDLLGNRKIIPPDFARSVRDMAGLRNVLVHEYTVVDLNVVSRVLNHRLGDFLSFAEHIETYLKRQSI